MVMHTLDVDISRCLRTRKAGHCIYSFPPRKTPMPLRISMLNTPVFTNATNFTIFERGFRDLEIVQGSEELGILTHILFYLEAYRQG